MKCQILALLLLLLGRAVAQETSASIHLPSPIDLELNKRGAGPKPHQPRPLKGKKHPYKLKHQKNKLQFNAPYTIYHRLYKTHRQIKKIRLSMTETKRVLSAANVIRRELELGPTVMIKTPQGKRLGVLLQYQGQTVTVVFVHSNGQLVKLHRSPLLSNPPSSPFLSFTARQHIKQQLSRASLSGAVEVTPRHYRVFLVLEGIPVAILRLKQQDLKPVFKPKGLGKSK